MRHWSETEEALKQIPDSLTVQTAARDAFWDWTLLELLVQSGLRVEEASELTTLDILKRRMPDGRIYYMLHAKPSKYDRARVIPIGDSLGRVIVEIILHVKQFYVLPISCKGWVICKSQDFAGENRIILRVIPFPAALCSDLCHPRYLY